MAEVLTPFPPNGAVPMHLSQTHKSMWEELLVHAELTPGEPEPGHLRRVACPSARPRMGPARFLPAHPMEA